ncbi:MAG TPA: DUF4249 domain-containing protein [Puia sp.]|jgi:hypothetical protein|nr:DUF4249 domain-containing protein [Puia sp.]
MKHATLYKTLVLLTMMTASACKKVINVDLNSVVPQIVIEGEVTNDATSFFVRISKTVDFSASNSFPPVTGAKVRLTDTTNGVTDLLVEVNPGLYQSIEVGGVPHHTYALDVVADGKEYTAYSTMPAQVRLDSITFAKNIGFDNKMEINAVAGFQDPVGLGNYYQFTETVNHRVIPDIFVFEDRLSDGKFIQYPLYNDSAYLQPGDTLTLTMNCIDKNIYNYFFQLMNVAGSNNFQSATPANPTGNISNGALGYFSAHTTQSASIIVY